MNSLSAISFAIVFLDIVMDGINGMETAREMRKRCPETLLVFVTTEEDYALEGYEVEAAGFLIKNNSDQSTRLDKLMQRLTSRLQPRQYSGGIRKQCFPSDTRHPVSCTSKC